MVKHAEVVKTERRSFEEDFWQLKSIIKKMLKFKDNSKDVKNKSNRTSPLKMLNRLTIEYFL